MKSIEQKLDIATNPTDAKKANDEIANSLQIMFKKSEVELKRIRSKLTYSYWILIVLSILMFSLGIVLLLVPVIAAFDRDIDSLQSIISAGFGIGDIAALFLYGPIEKIHKNMGDISQINIALNSYRNQIGLRLWQLNGENRDTIGEAAIHIGNAAEKIIILIQRYFEDDQKKGKAKEVTQAKNSEKKGNNVKIDDND